MVYAKIGKENKAMEKAIEDAEQGNSTDMYAGDGDESEFQAAADALKTTIIIARPDVGLFQLIHPGNHPLVNAYNLDLKAQKSVLYLINTNRNHFNTLLPVIQHESDHIPVARNPNKTRENIIPKCKPRENSRTNKNVEQSPSGKLSEEICDVCDVCAISGGKRKTIKRKRRKTTKRKSPSKSRKSRNKRK